MAQLNRYALITILLLGGISGCVRTMSCMDYIIYVDSERSGLIKNKEIGEFTFRSEFKTIEYLLIKESLKEGNVVNLDNLKHENNQAHFYLKIGAKNQNDFLKQNLTIAGELESRIDYFTQEVKEDLILVVNEVDTVECSYSIFERNFGISKLSTLVIGFELNDDIKSTTTFSLIYNDRVLGTGPLVFKYLSKDVNSLPNIKI